MLAGCLNSICSVYLPEEPTRYESDANCAHNRDWNHFLWAVDLFGEMGSTVETSERPVRVYETDDEGHTALLPASVVDESSKDELGVLMGWGDRRNRNEDNGEGYQRGPERGFGDCGEGLAIAVEEEAEYVCKLICEEDVPGLDHAMND
jgi:hypothetical protein